MSKLYEHPLDSRHRILAALEPHLPTCLALYRRIQFQHFTPTSHLFCSLAPHDLEKGETGLESTGPWIAAYVDRSKRPETEVWMFGSWESEPDESHDEQAAADLTEALVAQIGNIGLPNSLETSQSTLLQNGATKALSKDSATKVERGEYEGHLANPNIVLFGSLHERTTMVIKKLGLLSDEFVGADIPYRKYIFDLSTKNTEDMLLPEGLVWGKVQPNHFSLVRSRTQIPRQDHTLIQLPSLGIFPQAHVDPVAWSFLGPDASLSSLHVEPERRGQGLAKVLANKLFAEGMNIYGEEANPSTDRWAHADVAVDNIASNNVCKGLGGSWSFHVYWVRVDTGKASA